MRQSTRSVQYSPKATYTDFSKGMEYTAHAKDSTNPRAQLIKNMEIDADGKLSVRRPLVPVNFSIQTSTEGTIPNTIEDYSKDAKLPANHKKLKTVYAPYRELNYKFFNIIKGPAGTLTVDSNNPNNKSQVYIRYIDNVTNKWTNFANPILDDFIWSEAEFPNREIEYVFQPGVETLMLNTKNRPSELYFTARDGFSIIKPEVHIATASEITNLGINLFSTTPLFISNAVENTNDTSISIEALLPYKATNTSAYTVSRESYIVSPANFVYDASPQPTDHIILKPLLTIPRGWLEHEASKFFVLDTSTTPMSLKWAAGMEAALQTGLGPTSQNTLASHSPLWHWRSTEGNTPSVDLKPATGGAIRMPVFFTLLYDTDAMDRFFDIVLETLKVANNTQVQNNITPLVEKILDGNNISWRGDILPVLNTYNDSRIFELSISFPKNEFVTVLQEVPLTYSSPSTPNTSGIKEFHITRQTDGNKNVFTLSNGPDNDIAKITEALNPNTNSGILITPTPISMSRVHVFPELWLTFGDQSSEGIEINGFVLHMPSSLTYDHTTGATLTLRQALGINSYMNANLKTIRINANTPSFASNSIA